MKKAILILAVAVFSVLLAGCGNSDTQQAPQAGQDQSAVQPESADNQSDQPQNQENKITASLKDLLGMGKSLKCSATSGTDKFTADSTTYVSGEKVRSDVKSQVENAGEINTRIIITDGWMYMWTEGKNMGMKLNVNEMNQNNAPGKTGENQDLPPADNQLSSKENFDCSPWKYDQSLFVIPADVVFTDQTAQVSDVKNKVQQTPGSVCDACDSIPNAAAKAQCKANCPK